MSAHPLSIIVHGGAWSIPDDLLKPHADGCRQAALAGWVVLQAGGSALDAVEAAVRVLEDDPTFDAGTGSFLNLDGQVELDAGIMDGGSLASGAVAAVHRVRNPITLARRVLETDDNLIVGPGATRLAERVGIPLCSEDDLIIDRERERWQALQSETRNLKDVLFGPPHMGTVGAVAYDRQGTIAAGTSTGGSLNKWPGRVGDVPQVGSGFYADNVGGGASCTGWGEGIMRINMAKLASDLMAAGHPAPDAARLAIETLGDKLKGVAGIILIDGAGRVGHAYSTHHMAYAYLTVGMTDPVAFI